MKPIPLMILTVAAACFTPARAVVPTTVPFQGRLTDSSGRPVADGQYNVRLSLYNGPAEAQSATESLTFSTDTVRLTHGPVIVNSETVKKWDNSVTFTRNVAYTVNYSAGVITRASATTIPNGTTVTVAYQWTPTSRVSTTRTVQAMAGLFATSIDLLPYQLTGEDWLQVEVDRGGVFEALLPRVRLTAVPYALKTASLDGADGGTVMGNIDVQGDVAATQTVSGQGASFRIGQFPITRAGVVGTGVTGTGGEAPGVLALGANDTGLALEARGRVHATGDMAVDGAANVAGQMNSAGVQTGVILATGLSTTGALPASQALHTDKDIGTGNIYAQGEIIVTREMRGASVSVGTANVYNGLTAGSASVSGELTADNVVARHATVSGLDIGGPVSGTGALKPDYTALGSVWPAAGHYTAFYDLPADLADAPSLLIDVMETNDSSAVRTYWSPQHLTWNTTVTNGVAVSLSPMNPGSGTIHFRLRVWKTR